MIILTIGGNDLLGILPEIAHMLSGQEVTDIAQAFALFAMATPEQYEALQNDPAFAARMKTVLEDVATNLQAIAAFFKEKAPDARVIFLKQYNPMHNVQGFESFGQFGGGFLAAINQAVEATAAAFGYETVDIPSVIDDRAEELTNIRLFDIHPNAKGHGEIAEAVAQHLGLSLDQNEETEDPTSTETEAPAEPETEAATDTSTEAPTEPVTEAVTEAPADKPADTDAPADKKGCGASMHLLSVLVLSVCAALALKRSR
jgi:lysophospholipase L1-like esterase